MNKKLLAYILIPFAGVSVATASGVAVANIPALTEKDNELEERIEQLEQQVQELQSQIDTLRENMETATAEIRADYLAKIEEITTKIESLQTELQELETKHEQDKAELIAGYNTKITDLQSYVDGKVTELNADIKKNEKAIADLTAQHNQDKQALEDDYNNKIAELRNDLDMTKSFLENDYNSKIEQINFEIENLEEQIKDLKTKHNDNIETINTQISNLQSQIDTRKQEIENLKTKEAEDISSLSSTVASQMNDLISDYDSKINNLKSETNTQISQINLDIANLNTQLTSLISTHSEDIQNLKDEYDEKLSSLNEELRDYINEIKDEYGNKLAQLNEDFEEQIAELQTSNNTSHQQLEDDIASLTEKHNQDIQNLKDEYDDKLEQYMGEVDDQFESVVSDYNTKIQTLADSLSSNVSTLQASIQQNKTDIDNLKTKEAEDVASLTSSLNTAISNLNDSLLSQKTTLENDYNSKLEALEADYNAKIESLTAIVDADKAALVAFKDQYITDKAALEAALQNGLDTLKADYLAKVATINSTITSLTNDITTLENEMNQAIEDIQNDYNSKINALITRINALETVQYHTVTFNTNGGSSIASIQVEYGKKITKPTDPTKTGYNFENWTYEGKEWVFFGYVVTENLTLDAKWSDPIEYSITYDLKGGTLSSSNPTSYTVEDDYSLISPTKTGYTFAGWKDQNNNSITSITKGMTGNKVLTANWTVNYYSLSVSINNSSKGTVTGSGTYAYGSNVTVSAAAFENEKFKGWYFNDNKVSASSSYSFIMPEYNYSLVAKFVEETYTISFETNGGTPISPITAEAGDEIDVSTTKVGYTFVGWYTDSSLSMSSYFELGNTMPAYNGTLYCKWVLSTYSITYHLDKNVTNNTSNPTSYTINDTTTLYDPTIQYGTFVGWYTDAEYQNQITQIVPGMYGDLDLYCKVNHQVFTITFETNGGDPIDTLSYYYNDEITIPTPNKTNYIFKGWYTNSRLTTPNAYKTMPAQNITLYAKWFVSADSVGMYTPFTVGAKTYLYYGSYPQDVVSENNTVKELSKLTITNSRGYYEYNGTEYAKQKTNIYSSSYTYSNGESAVSNETRYFKVEPILWRVLSSDVSGNYTLLAESALNAHRYASSSNNYKNSEIRSWLNDAFYDQAFKTAEKGSILTTTVKNDASTTNYSVNQYACEDTQDRVYLLSYKDYINTSYGFSSSSYSEDSARCCQPTDYALANNCFIYTGSSYTKNCSYWARSPYSGLSDHACYVRYDGTLNDYNVNNVNYGVRPAITINL